MQIDRSKLQRTHVESSCTSACRCCRTARRRCCGGKAESQDESQGESQGQGPQVGSQAPRWRRRETACQQSAVEKHPAGADEPVAHVSARALRGERTPRSARGNCCCT